MRRWLRVPYLAVGLALFAGLLSALGLERFREALQGASLLGLATFLLVSTAVFFLYAVRSAVILRVAGAAVPRITVPTLLGLRAAAHAVGSLVPSAHWSGEPVRALLLRRRGVDWTTAGLAVAEDRLLELTASAIAGPVYVAIFFFASHASARVEAWILAAMTAGLAALALLYARAAGGRRLLSAFVTTRLLFSVEVPLAAIEKRFAEFVRSPSFVVALLLSLLTELLIIGEFWALTRAFHVALPLPTILGVLVGLGVSHLAPIPAAVGSLEAAQIGVLALAGGSADLGMAIGLLTRLRESLWIVVGLGVLYAEGLAWGVLPETTSGNTSAIDPKR